MSLCAANTLEWHASQDSIILIPEIKDGGCKTGSNNNSACMPLRNEIPTVKPMFHDRSAGRNSSIYEIHSYVLI